METSLAIIGAVTAAVGVLGGLWFRSREVADGESRRIMRDLEIFEALPPESEVRQELADAIDEQTRNMLRNRDAKSRNLSDAAIGGLGFAFLTAVAVQLVVLGGWWLVTLLFVVPLALVFVFGLVQGLSKVERDASGRVVRDS